MNDKALKISPADDDDWMDLTPAKAAAIIKADATVRLTADDACTKNSASIAMRNAVAEWVEKNGAKFRIQIGGSNANKLRLVPDPKGPFTAIKFKGTYRVLLRNVAAWPFETRMLPVEAAASYVDKALILTLPEDFAKPIGSRPKPALKPASAKTTTPPPSTAPEVRRVVGMGEPAPGRSALDQRKAEAARGK